MNRLIAMPGNYINFVLLKRDKFTVRLLLKLLLFTCTFISSLYKIKLNKHKFVYCALLKNNFGYTTLKLTKVNILSL